MIREAASKSLSVMDSWTRACRAKSHAVTAIKRASALMISSACIGVISRWRLMLRIEWPSRSGNRSDNSMPNAAVMAWTSHPAKQCSKIRPSSSSLIDSDGVLSRWAGHSADQRPSPRWRTASSRSSRAWQFTEQTDSLSTAGNLNRTYPSFSQPFVNGTLIPTNGSSAWY